MIISGSQYEESLPSCILRNDCENQVIRSSNRFHLGVMVFDKAFSKLYTVSKMSGTALRHRDDFMRLLLAAG